MNNIITGKSNEDALYALGAEIDERIPKAKTAEEKAFLLGHLNLLAAMLKPVVENDHCKGFKLNLNYKTALKLYLTKKIKPFRYTLLAVLSVKSQNSILSLL